MGLGSLLDKAKQAMQSAAKAVGKAKDKILAAAKKVAAVFSPKVKKAVVSCGDAARNPRTAATGNFTGYRQPIETFPGHGTMARFKGYHFTPTSGKYKGITLTHNGADYPASAGTKVFPVTEGKIVWSGTNFKSFGAIFNDGSTKSGPAIVVEHKDKSGKVFYVVYGHVMPAKEYKYISGESVSPDQPIGEIAPFFGGASDKPDREDHLHLGVFQGEKVPNNGWGMSADPVKEGWQNPDMFLSGTIQ